MMSKLDAGGKPRAAVHFPRPARGIFQRARPRPAPPECDFANLESVTLNASRRAATRARAAASYLMTLDTVVTA
jgi:hypothetical protein